MADCSCTGNVQSLQRFPQNVETEVAPIRFYNIDCVFPQDLIALPKQNALALLCKDALRFYDVVNEAETEVVSYRGSSLVPQMLAYDALSGFLYVSSLIDPQSGENPLRVDVINTATGEAINHFLLPHGHVTSMLFFGPHMYLLINAHSFEKTDLYRVEMNEKGEVVSTETESFDGFSRAAMFGFVNPNEYAIYNHQHPVVDAEQSGLLLVNETSQRWIEAPPYTGHWLPHVPAAHGLLPIDVAQEMIYISRFNCDARQSELVEFDRRAATSGATSFLETAPAEDGDSTLQITHMMMDGSLLYVSHTRDSALYAFDPNDRHLTTIVKPIDAACWSYSTDAMLADRCYLGPAVMMNGVFYQIMGQHTRFLRLVAISP